LQDNELWRRVVCSYVFCGREAADFRDTYEATTWHRRLAAVEKPTVKLE
jgi:hypothetical protein